ncbi:MAG: phosphoribosylanthranilate isomerase, partial [Bacteroides sp.]|nr:phosphoribosylanthranilate isomerase [Bacteroides sp.]
MNMIVKVCGMTEADNIRQVDVLGVNLIGFIFYPKSPRYLYQIPQYLPILAKRVGVFVNESKENVLMYADRFGLDYIQLHGNESPKYCRSLHSHGFRIIKAFSIAFPKDLLVTSDYEGFCDYYLFDTPT